MNKPMYLMLFVVGAFLLLGCCSATGKVSESNPSGNTAATSTSSPSSPAESAKPNVVSAPPAQSANVENAKIGKMYTIDYSGSKYEVTLLNAEFAHSTGYFDKTNYLMANFEIKNIGDESQFVSLEIYALDSTGEKYDNTIAFGVSDKYSKTLDWLKKLPPGTKTSGWTAIEISENITSLDLFFEYTNYFSSKPNYIKWVITKNE